MSLSATSSYLLNVPGDGDTTTPLLQCSTTLSTKKFSQILSPNLFLHHLRPEALCCLSLPKIYIFFSPFPGWFAQIFIYLIFFFTLPWLVLALSCCTGLGLPSPPTLPCSNPCSLSHRCPVISPVLPTHGVSSWVFISSSSQPCLLLAKDISHFS